MSEPENISLPAAWSVALIDDNATLRDLLRDGLKMRFKLTRCEAYGEGPEGLEQVLRDPPDLLIVDLFLPGMSGLEIIRAIEKAHLKTRIILLTGHPAAVSPAELLALGVAGFLEKTTPLERLFSAVIQVMEGGVFFSLPKMPSEPQGAGHVVKLTPRESQIASMVVDGLLSKEIADKLGLSVRTVEKHRENLMGKLGVRDVASLVRVWLRESVERRLAQT